ncbi:MAG: hypothetical protein ACKO04_08025 [Actinomycetes bacterium]
MDSTWIRVVLPATVGGALLLSGAVTYLTRYRATPQAPYQPRVAWTRASIYFGVCWLVSAAVGTWGRIVTEPVATAAQRSDGTWLLWTAGVVALIVVAYPVVWARWTLTFDRRSRVLAQLGFGIVWGLSAGQLLASYFVLAERTGWPRWGVWLLAWGLIGAWQGMFQDLFWDVWVTPEHDTPTTIRTKVAACHIPNVTFTLTYLVLFGNVAIFVGLQTLALCSAALAMRFPAWNEAGPVLAPTTGPGPFGILRASGYLTDDPHPYRTQRLARRAAAVSPS